MRNPYGGFFMPAANFLSNCPLQCNACASCSQSHAVRITRNTASLERFTTMFEFVSFYLRGSVTWFILNDGSHVALR